MSVIEGEKMGESESIFLASEILRKKGFVNLKYLGRPFDLEAEKDGVKYAVEVKRSNISFTTSYSQLKQTFVDYSLSKSYKVLLMFVDEIGHYFMFQLTDADVL